MRHYTISVMEINKFITEKELGERLHVAQATIFKWRLERKLPFVRIGRHILYDWDSVCQWVQEQEGYLEQGGSMLHKRDGTTVPYEGIRRRARGARGSTASHSEGNQQSGA